MNFYHSSAFGFESFKRRSTSFLKNHENGNPLNLSYVFIQKLSNPVF